MGILRKDYSMKKYTYFILTMIFCGLILSGCQKESSAPPLKETSRALYDEFISRCDCPVGADNMIYHKEDCEVARVLELLDGVEGLYTSNKIDAKGYAMYQYVLDEAEARGEHFDSAGRITLGEENQEYDPIMFEYLGIVSTRMNRRSLMNSILMQASQKKSRDMTVLKRNDSDARQAAGDIKVSAMTKEQIYGLVFAYFIDGEGNVLSEKVADKYFGGKNKLKLSKEQLAWADEAYNMHGEGKEYISYERFREIYKGFDEEQKELMNSMWGVEY